MVKRKGWSQTMFFGGEGGQIPSQDIYFSSPKIFYLFIISTTFLRLFIKFWNHFHHCWPYISERYHHRQIALKCFNFLSTFIFREQILLEIMFKAVAIGVDGARLCLFWRSKFWFVAFESLFWLYTVKSAQSWYQWRDIQPSMLTHTRNSCSAFTHPKCTHTAVNTHTPWTHTWSSGQPFMLRCPGSSCGFGALLKGTSVVVLKVERALDIHSPPPTIPAMLRLKLASFGLQVRLSNIRPRLPTHITHYIATGNGHSLSHIMQFLFI